MTRHTAQQTRRTNHTPLVIKPAAISLAIALCWCCVNTQAQSLPTGAQAIAGTASLSQIGKNLAVTTTNIAGGNHSAINWQSFSIGAGYATNFIQPSAASTSINRVVTNNPSQIFGTLSSNGKLVLVNPGGITVGKGAVVDTAGFTASAVGMAEKDAKAGLLRFADDGVTGDINVHGRIISRGGDVVLFAPNVSSGSEAVIEAPDGTVTLAAGRSAQITGTGMDAVLLEVKAPTDSALNLGTLKGNAVGIFASTLKHSGLAQATGITSNGGKVTLVSSESTLVSGNIRATQNTAEGETGGTIVVTSAKSVVVADGASIDASGTKGGGTVSIGGGWQGKDASVLNALTTEVQKTAVINASATGQGKGGTIAVWSNGSTQTHGQLIARGAGVGGDGGKVETSGHTLTRSSIPDVLPGPGGKAGTWLIDPDDVTIQLGTAGTASPYNGNAASTQPTIYESEIETLGNTTNIEILAQRSIKAVADTGTTSDQTLVVDGHSIKVGTLNALTGTQCNTASSCGIDLTAFTNGIQTKGGDFKAATGFDPNIGATALNNTGVQAAPILLPSIDTSAPSGRMGNGSVFLSSSGNVTVGGSIVTKAGHAFSGQAGSVSIQAAGTATLGQIDSSGGDFSANDLQAYTGGPNQALNGANVSISANKVVLNDNIIARSGSIVTAIAGNNVNTFANTTSSNDLLGKGGDVNITAQGQNLTQGESSVVFAKSTDFNRIDTSSGGPNAPVSSGPGFQGGNVSIEALKGSIDTGPLGISVVAKGGDGNPYTRHDGMSAPGQGGGGGSVTVRAMDSVLAGDGIRGNGMSVETQGGSGGRFNLQGQAADWGRGGLGGNVTIETTGRVALNNLYVDTTGGAGSVGGNAGSVRIEGQKGVAMDYANVYASGGYGQTDTLGTQAPLAEGGKGGRVEVNVGSGNLSKLTSTVTDASLYVAANGGDFSAFQGDSTMGGDAGSVRVSGSNTSQILGEYQLSLGASGGSGGINASPLSRSFAATTPLPVSLGKGGTIEVEMGSITLGANSAMHADGGSNPGNLSGEGEAGKIRLLALNGSISESAAASALGINFPVYVTARSHECSTAGTCAVELQAYNGDISLGTATKIAAKKLAVQTSASTSGGNATGAVNLAYTDVGYLRGSVAGNLQMENVNFGSSNGNDSLTLGVNNGTQIQGLNVGGTAQILSSIDGEGYAAGKGVLRIAEGVSASANRWNITTGKLLMGDAASRLQANDSVNLKSGYNNIQLLGSTSTAPVIGNAFRLYQDTIAGIDAPVLRLDNAAKGTAAFITFDTPSGGLIDFANDGNANPNLRLVLNTSGKVTQSDSSPVRVKELIIKAQSINLATSSNFIDQVSAKAEGGTATGTQGQISIQNTTDIRLGGISDSSIGTGPALVATGNSPEVQANVQISAQRGQIILAGDITAPNIGLNGRGGIVNADNNMHVLDASSSTVPGQAISLLSDGSIGSGGTASDAAIAVKLGSGSSVLIGQTTTPSSISDLSASLHFATGTTGTALTSQIVQSGNPRDLSLESEGAWQVDSGLGAKSIKLRANNGNVSFASGTSTGSLQGTSFVFVDAEKGAILGDPNANTNQVRSDVVGLMARDGVSAKVNANAVFARSEGGTGATGPQDVSITNSNNDPWTLAHAHSTNGNININSNGLVKVQGEYPFAGADQGKPLGIEGNSVSITGGGINVYRSIIARSGDLSLNAGSGDLNVSMSTTNGANSVTPEVVLSGTNVSLRGRRVFVTSDVSPSPTALSLPGNNNDPAPAYPVATSLATAPGDVKIGASASLQIEATTGVRLENDIALRANNVNVHSSAGNVELANFNPIKGANSVFVSAEAGAISGDFNAGSAQASSAVVGLIARDGVSAKVDAGVLFARSQGGTGAVANAQDVNVRNTRTDWTLATAASAGGNVTVVTSGHMRVQGEFPFAGADLGKPLGVEGNNVTLSADGGIDVHRSVIARSGDLVIDAKSANLLIAPKATDLSTQPLPQVHLGGVSVDLYGQNITVTETPVSTTTPFTFSAPNQNNNTAPTYTALLGSIATDPGTVKVGAVSALTLVANGAVDLQARNGLQAGDMVSVEAKGGTITGSNTGTVPQIKANMVALSARDAINARVDTSQLLAVSEGGAGATGSQNVNITNNLSDWTLAAASSAGGSVEIIGSGRIRVAGESPFSGNDLGAPLGVSGNAVSINAGNGLDVHRSVIARSGNLDLNAGTGDLLISPQMTQFGEQSTPQVHLGGAHVSLSGQNVEISGVPVARTRSLVSGPTTTYGSSSLMPYPLLGGSIASEPGAVKVGATTSLSISANAGITLQGGNNIPVADVDDVVAAAGSGVRLVAPSVNLTAQSLQVNGGAGADAYASIQYSTALNLAISGGGSAISFTSGTGSNADAAIFSTASTSTLNTASTPNMLACTTCPPTWYQGENPLNDSVSNTGLGVSKLVRPVSTKPVEEQATTTTVTATVSEQTTITKTLVDIASDDKPTTTTSSTQERKEKAKESVVVEATGNVCT